MNRLFPSVFVASPFRSSVWALLVLAGVILITTPLPAKESSRRTPVVLAVERVGPAVVNIATIVHEKVRPFSPFHGEDFFKDFFPELFSREYTRSSLGSGLIIDGKKGYVVTNHHVVARATEIKVITADEREFKAKLLGSDPRSDLAVLQIASDQKFPEVKMGNSDDLMMGETVIAIGNPFGLSHTVTTGVVSALDRSVRAEETIYRHFIQTDASINPGNSGGPLLNIEGEVIGINTAIYQKAQGIGFAIPINKVGRIVKELLRAGEVRAPWLGLELQELTEGLRKSFGFPAKMKGLLVNDVTRDGPAARAGIHRGDILVRMEGQIMSSLEEYRGNLSEYTPGDSLRLSLFRKGEEIGLSVRPSPFPLELAVEMVDRRMGIRVAEADRGTKRQYSLKDGVIIDKVRQGSEAARVGLRSGDLLLKVNEMAVSGLEDFQKAIAAYHHLSSLTLFFRRGPYGFSITLAF